MSHAAFGGEDNRNKELQTSDTSRAPRGISSAAPRAAHVSGGSVMITPVATASLSENAVLLERMEQVAQIEALGTDAGAAAVRAQLKKRWVEPHAALVQFADGTFGKCVGVYKAAGEDAAWQISIVQSKAQRVPQRVAVSTMERDASRVKRVVFGLCRNRVGPDEDFAKNRDIFAK